MSNIFHAYRLQRQQAALAAPASPRHPGFVHLGVSRAKLSVCPDLLAQPPEGGWRISTDMRPPAAAPARIDPVRCAFAVLLALAATLAAVPAMSQQRQQRAKPERTAIGLPVLTADGKAIGWVLATGTDQDDQAVLVAEIKRPLGIGSDAVAIPTGMFVKKASHIELTLTEVEVRDTLARAKRKR
jgi:hypothetical protein